MKDTTLTWTKEKPTKSGYFWMRRTLKGVQTPPVVRYFPSPKHCGTFEYGDIGREWEFAGPIPEPQEAGAQ